MARRNEDNGEFWPWVLGGLAVAGAGVAAFLFWPSDAMADETAKPLTDAEKTQIKGLACLCWRAGNRSSDQLAACVFKRLRPNAAASGAVYAAVKAATDGLMGEASRANRDLCDYIEGNGGAPEPAPVPKKESIPNISGDPAGYNTKAYPNFLAFRNGLNMLGYGVELKDEKPPASKVRAFQNDWNEVSAGVARGVVKGPWAFKPRGYHYVKGGKIGADGVPGKDVANALQIGQANLAAGRAWQSMVAQAKAAKALDAVKKLFGE